MAPFRSHSQTSSLCSISEEHEGDFLPQRKEEPVDIVHFDNSSIVGFTQSLESSQFNATINHHRRHDSFTPSTPSNVNIKKIIQATQIRRTKQARTSFMMPSPRRATPVSEATTLKLGDSECTACSSNSSHRLIPCHHTLCYDHFLQHDDESQHRPVCARCHQVVLQLLDLSDKSKITVLASPLALSPQADIWSNSPPSISPFRSIDEHLAIMPPVKGVSAGVEDNNNISSSPWNNHNKSHSVHHSRRPSAPPAMSPRAHKQSNSIGFDPSRAFHELPPRSNPAAPQQNMMRMPNMQYPPLQPQTVSNMQQPMNFQYPPIPMPMQHSMGAHQQPDRYPYMNMQNMQQPPVFQPMAPYQPVPLPPSMQSPPPFGAQPGNAYYQPGTQFNMAGMPPDPFSNNNNNNNNGNNRARAQTFQGHTPTGPRAMAPDHNGMSANHFNTPVKSPQPQTEASRLAQAIKDGLWEDLSPKTAPPVRDLTSPPPQETRWALQQPVVRSQAAIVPEIHPNPAFLANGTRPSLEEAFEHVPFVEQARHHKSSTHGVIKINNIPYGTTKNEVIAVLGRNARIVSQPPGTPFYAIHIIMERSTGKTMDCFVELETASEAQICLTNYHTRCVSGRAPRIGDRHVEIESSSQEALMRELFSRAKCVTWEGQTPSVYTTSEPFNSGFAGFLTGEEMVMVMKHAETPQRSPFAQRCHNRTYESTISTLHKYPWFAVGLVSLRERTLLFKTSVTLLRSLVLAIRKNSNPAVLNRALLQELLTAALVNPGFNHQQKSFIVDVMHGNGYTDLLSTIPYVHLGPLGGWWTFEVLAKKPDASFELVEYYISLLRSSAATQDKGVEGGTLAQRSAMLVQESLVQSPFGDFKVEFEGDVGEMSLAKVAALEWDAVELALRKVLVSGEAVLAIGDGSTGN